METILIHSKDLLDNVSAEYNKKEIVDFFKLLSKFNPVTLKSLVYFITDGSHQTPDYQESGVKFIMVTNLTQDIDIDFDNTKYIPKEFDNSLKHCKPHAGDILFSKVGTVGIAKMVPENCPNFNIFVSLCVLKKVMSSKINPKYLEIFLNSKIIKKQIDKVVKGIGVPDFHLEDISNLLIIVPDKGKQKEIIHIHKNIIEKIKENKKNILNTTLEIENTIYSNLQLKIKEKKIKKTFSVNSNLTRFDPIHESNIFIRKNDITSNLVDWIPLSNICFEIMSGQRPKGGVGNIEEGIPSLGGEHISKDGEILYNEMKYIPKEFEVQHKSTRIKLNDILICKDGATTGKVGLIDESFKYKLANINEHVFILRLLPEYNARYVFTLLKSKLGQEQILRKVSGGAQGGITPEVFNDVFVPLPKDMSIITKIEKEFKNQNDRIKEMKERITKFTLLQDDLIVKMILNKSDYKDAINELKKIN